MFKQPQNQITSSIDNIVSHEYFIEKVTDLINKNQKQSSIFIEQEYLHENEIVKQINDVIGLTIEHNLRKILQDEFVNIEKQLSAIKNQMYGFMESQTKITFQIQKQVQKLNEENKRKIITESIAPGIVPVRGRSIRTLRNNLANTLESSIDKKSHYSQILDLRKEIENLREQVAKGANFSAISDQLNDFKVQTKIAIESLKYQIKKNSPLQRRQEKQKPTQTKIKQFIEESIKRGIKSNTKIYSSFAEQVSHIKIKLELIEQTIQEQVNKNQIQHQEYFSSQLKSLWLVLNDTKKHVQILTEKAGLSMVDFD